MTATNKVKQSVALRALSFLSKGRKLAYLEGHVRLLSTPQSIS
jgi:hypothetical protein